MKLLRRIVIAISKRSLSVSVAKKARHGTVPWSTHRAPSSSVCWAVVLKPCRAAGLSQSWGWPIIFVENLLVRGLPSSLRPSLVPSRSLLPTGPLQHTPDCVPIYWDSCCTTRHTSPGHPCCGAWQICIVTSCHPYYRGQGNLAKSDPSLPVSPRF